VRTDGVHPINQRRARANNNVAFVDHMAIRNELVARTEHSSRAARGRHDQNCGALWEWSPKHASHKTRRRGVGLQHEGVGSCFCHSVRVEMLSRDMQSELKLAIQQMRNCALGQFHPRRVGRSLVGCNELESQGKNRQSSFYLT
jgi:hypothetical protein